MSMQISPLSLDTDFAVRVSTALTEVLACVRDRPASAVNSGDSAMAEREPFILGKGENLVAELLAFGGRQALRPERIEVMPFLSSFAEFVRGTLDARIDVVVQVGSDCLPWRLDREALRQALMQLVLNASVAMPNGGRLLFSATDDQLSFNRGTSLDVVDTGTGISTAILEMAPLPFFSTKEDSPLSGMGLPAVAGFVAQSGGFMFIASTVGDGTSIKLKLPVFE